MLSLLYKYSWSSTWSPTPTNCSTQTPRETPQCTTPLDQLPRTRPSCSDTLDSWSSLLIWRRYRLSQSASPVKSMQLFDRCRVKCRCPHCQSICWRVKVSTGCYVYMYIVCVVYIICVHILLYYMYLYCVYYTVWTHPLHLLLHHNNISPLSHRLYQQ